MTKSKLELLDSMALCGGRLLLLRRPARLTRYGSAAPTAGGLQVRFEIDSQQTTVTRLDRLGSILRKIKCHVPEWIVGHEAQFAQMIAPLIKLGRVVSSVDLYSFLQDKYGISLSAHMPRLEGNRLRFICGQFDLAKPPSIVDVTIDLASFELQTASVTLANITPPKDG
jgi:hypothetical protein